MTGLKFVSYNIQNGRHSEKIIKNLSEFAEAGANLFCLQELRKTDHPEFLGHRILKVLGSDWRAEYFISDSINTFDLGASLFWNSKVLEAVSLEKLFLPKLKKMSWWEWALEKYQRKSTESIQRCALIGTFKFGNKILRATSLWLDWQGGWKNRANQLAFLKQHLDKLPPAENEIICGDFNTLGGPLKNLRQQKYIGQILGPEFYHALPGHSRTGPLWQNLDHVFLKNLRATRAAVKRVKGSDHYPIVVETMIS